jgi:hypothetical protein
MPKFQKDRMWQFRDKIPKKWAKCSIIGKICFHKSRLHKRVCDVLEKKEQLFGFVLMRIEIKFINVFEINNACPSQVSLEWAQFFVFCFQMFWLLYFTRYRNFVELKFPGRDIGDIISPKSTFEKK